jgi:hypothetical protein
MDFLEFRTRRFSGSPDEAHELDGLHIQLLRTPIGHIGPGSAVIDDRSAQDSPEPDPHRIVEPDERVSPPNPFFVGSRMPSFEDPPVEHVDFVSQPVLLHFASFYPTRFPMDVIHMENGQAGTFPQHDCEGTLSRARASYDHYTLHRSPLTRSLPESPGHNTEYHVHWAPRSSVME